jgi:hypothetical protein
MKFGNAVSKDKGRTSIIVSSEKSLASIRTFFEVAPNQPFFKIMFSRPSLKCSPL